MSDDENDDYMITAERAAKQRYLTEELIDLSYDPNLFMDFISKVKEPNIDLWTFEELQEIISKFKMHHRPGDTLDIPKSQTQPEPVQQAPEPIVNKPQVQSKAPEKVPDNHLAEERKSNEVLSSQNLAAVSSSVQAGLIPSTAGPKPEIQPEEIKHELTLLKTKNTEKNGLTECSDLKVNVSEPLVTGGGIFSKKYVVYTVITEPFGWSVKRRYSDFVWLRSSLLTINLASYLPPLPEKKAKGNLEEKTIKKRQQFLNQFIVVLAKDPVMLGSSMVESFLREPDEKKFKKITKSTKLKKPETVVQTININGEASVEYGDCSRVYDPQEKYTSLAESITKKIKHRCSTLMETERKLADSIRKYAENIKELQDVQAKIPNNEGNSTICGAIHESLIKWSDHELENILGINSCLRIPFSYTHKEMEVLKEMLKERKSSYSNYKSLEAKQKPDKPRDALERSREVYGYYNHKVQREVDRVLKDETELGIRHFMNTAKVQAERVTQFHMIWGALMQKLSDMKFDMEQAS